MGRTAWIGAFVAIAVTACGGKQMMQVPPRLELARWGRVGLVTMTEENAQGSLNVVATDRFAEHLLSAQPGIEVLELGEAPPAVGSDDATRIDPEAARMLGDRHGVPVVFVGHMVASDVKPKASLIGGASFGAEVRLDLTMRLVSTESGGTLWRSSSWARDEIAALGLVDGRPYFSADDPDEAYGELVDLLIFEVTRDLRPTYVER